MEYVEEAVSAYRTTNYKSASVMIGATVEIMITEIRDEIVSILDSRKEPVSSKLKTWKTKEMLDAIIDCLANKISKEIDELKMRGVDAPIMKTLKEDIKARLPSIGAEFRKLRNEAGHPGTLKNITKEDVHANLLLFPKIAKILCETKKWIETDF
jgi:hypothetical protein